MRPDKQRLRATSSAREALIFFPLLALGVSHSVLIEYVRYFSENAWVVRCRRFRMHDHRCCFL